MRVLEYALFMTAKIRILNIEHKNGILCMLCSRIYLFKICEFSTTYIRMDKFQHNIEIKSKLEKDIYI